MVSEERLLNRLRSVEDPALGGDVVTLGLLTDVSVEDGAAAVTVAFDAPLSPAEWRMCDEIRALCRGLGLEPRIYADAGHDRALASGAKNAVAICAADREAGAPLVAANLAAALAGIGARVGVFDLRLPAAGPSDDARTWLDGVDPPALSAEEIVPPVERGIPIVRLAPALPAGDVPPTGGDVLELVVSRVVDAVRWGALDYLVVVPPAGTDGPTALALEAAPHDGSVVVSSATVEPERLRGAVREFGALGTTVLGAVGTVGDDEFVGAVDWFVGDPEPGCPNLGLVPFDRCTRPIGPGEGRSLEQPLAAVGRADRDPYRELALSVADRVGAMKRRSVVRRQLA